MNIQYRSDEKGFSFYTTDDGAERLVIVAEDLFFTLDGLVDALKADEGVREIYARELMTAASVLRSAMSVLG